VRLGQASRPILTPQPKPLIGPVFPEPTGPSRVIASTQIASARAGSTWLNVNERVRVAVAPAWKRRRCIYAYVKPPSADEVDRQCSWPRPRARELQVFPNSLGWTAVSSSRRIWVTVLVVIGQAGADIAHANVRFSDGSSVPMTVQDGVIFFLVPRENFSAGHRPAEVVARDATGHVVARKRLPYVR
jgi:hypothetical protein